MAAKLLTLGKSCESQAGDESIRDSQIWRPLSRAIQDQELVLDQNRFGHYRADGTRFREPCQCDEQMN
jgi:hypothetical protein